MSTEASNTLQALGGALNLGLSAPGVTATANEANVFSNAFLQQMGQLQTELATVSGLKPSTIAANIPLPTEAQTTLQNIATLFGNHLPQSLKTDPSIDLDDTLQSLNNVLQRLQALSQTTDAGLPSTDALASGAFGDSALTQSTKGGLCSHELLPNTDLGKMALAEPANDVPWSDDALRESALTQSAKDSHYSNDLLLNAGSEPRVESKPAGEAHSSNDVLMNASDAQANGSPTPSNAQQSATQVTELPELAKRAPEAPAMEPSRLVTSHVTTSETEDTAVLSDSAPDYVRPVESEPSIAASEVRQETPTAMISRKEQARSTGVLLSNHQALQAETSRLDPAMAPEMLLNQPVNRNLAGVNESGKSSPDAKPREKPSLKAMPAIDADAVIPALILPMTTIDEVVTAELPSSTLIEPGRLENSLPDAVIVTQESIEAQRPVIGSSNANRVPVVHAELQSSASMANVFDQGFNALLMHDASAADKTVQQAPISVLSDNHPLLSSVEDSTPVSGVVSDKPSLNVVGDVQRLNQTLPFQSPMAQGSMNKALTDPSWQNELGDKLIWMHKQSVPSVELRLNPEHLGQVLIKIDVQNDQATVVFSAQHQSVKEAIEASIPKLREMLGGQQLQLADINVSQHQSEQRQTRDFYQASSGQGGRNHQSQADDTQQTGFTDNHDILEEIEAGRAIATQGLLSLFA